MLQPVTLPLWAFSLILLFALVTFASHFLFPSVRWFFRKRAERFVARLNDRLVRPIEPFKLARRHDMIQRLIYDPEITKAIVEHSETEGVPENVAFEKARRYAREIVPSFSAFAYFSVGMRLAKWLGGSLYRMRIGAFDQDGIAGIDDKATVIFVINHRSNMDYVLVTYLVSRAGAMSYAVGEWARVWPLSGLIKMMGAYFIRRQSRGALYRRVLARYVQMATEGGVTQALFPEGGLSVTGAQMPPKLGLLSYIVDGADLDKRDVIFVPVGVNYDRIVEDRFLVAADKSGVRRFRPPLGTILRGLAKYIWQRVSRQSGVMGVASVGFGRPLRLSEFRGQTQELADDLMERIKEVTPVLAFPLVAYVIMEGVRDATEIAPRIEKLLLQAALGDIPGPRRSPEEFTKSALHQFEARGFITRAGDVLDLTASGHDILAYYARTVEHHLRAK